MSNWKTVCKLADLSPGTGVCALHEGEQVAIFLSAQNDQLYAVSNFDPFGEANVLSRGLMGSAGDEIYVASPLYKQHFDLLTGECTDDNDVAVPVYKVELASDQVLLTL